MSFYKQMVLAAVMTTVGTISQAQVGVQKIGVQANRRREEATPITNQATGQRVSMEQYAQLTKDDPYAYHLVPVYNEMGQPSAYTLRASTPEEHESHNFRDRNPAKQPRAGQIIAPFAMTGLDGKVYRSADLIGKVVILSFWISLDKPFWTDKQSADLSSALRSYPSSEAAPIVLGVLNSEKPPVTEHLNIKTLPFVPVPNAYGFHGKYHITSVPTIVVIDKTGKVAANLQGAEIYDKLKQVLTTVNQ